MRTYRTFSCKDSHFRICSPAYVEITREIVRQRGLLEQYIAGHRQFLTSMVPVGGGSGVPAIAQRMIEAASRVGVGPMAAVAGAMAQIAAEAALRTGTSEAIVENGGDIFIASTQAVRVGLYVGASHRLSGQLAFVVPPERMPMALCSSSGRLGHSTSLGTGDLATVAASNAALADAAATLACNLVRRPEDLDAVLARVAEIPGISGVLLIKDERVGMAGSLPELVRNSDPDIALKVTRDPHGSWQ